MTRLGFALIAVLAVAASACDASPRVWPDGGPDAGYDAGRPLDDCAPCTPSCIGGTERGCLCGGTPTSWCRPECNDGRVVLECIGDRACPGDYWPRGICRRMPTAP